MKRTEHNHGRFCLINYGNGTVYELIDKTLHMSAVMQGEDALAFEGDMDAAEACFPHKSFEEIMFWLWEVCEFGSAARPTA